MATTVTTPDWLAQHGAELRGNASGQSYAVYFGSNLEYVLNIVPVEGQYSCKVKQTINGRHLESGTAYPTVEEALHGGLEDLRRTLGW